MCLPTQHRCATLRAAREQAVTPEQQAKAKAELAKHFALVKFERMAASKFAFKAVNEPNKHITFEIDSMDQTKGPTPHYMRPSKDFDASGVVKHVVTAVRIPGVGVLEVVYQNNSAHDSSTTFTVVHRAIQFAAEKRGGVLPPVAHFQMDNCGRENKNNTMLAYFSWLVEIGVFQKIVVTFLPVG